MYFNLNVMDARWPSDEVQIISNLYKVELISRDN